MWFSAPSLTQPTRACAACSAGSSRCAVAAADAGLATAADRRIDGRALVRPCATAPGMRCRSTSASVPPPRRLPVSRSPSRAAGASFSTRMAVALNSAVPDFGSIASMVRMLVATSSGKCSVMNASPGRRPVSMCTGASTAPRRETIRTRFAFARRRGCAASSGRQVERLAAAQRRRVAARSARRC